MDTASTPPDIETRRLRRPSPLHWSIAIVLVALVTVTAVYAALSTQDANRAAGDYHAQRRQTESAVGQAKAQGYTDRDLAPITKQLQDLGPTNGVLWPGARTAAYQDHSAALVQLRGSLQAHLPRVLSGAKADVAQQVASGRTLLRQNAEQGGDVRPLQSRLDRIEQRAGVSTSIREVRELGREGKRVSTEAATQGATLKQENGVIQQAAAALLAQTQDVNAIRTQANATIVNGRNEATLAAYEAKPGRFKQIDALLAAYDRMEFFTPRLASPDLNQVAFGAAAVQRYNGQVHQLLQSSFGPRHIVLFFEAQRTWAYENGREVMSTLVTTGPRGNTTLGTDFGPMKVLRKFHPWKMQSPWPRGSPNWYPDAIVQYAVFFTNSGEAFHDANWQQDATLGPGSQYTEGTRSHGCIHLPWQGPNVAEWMYNWAQVGTPVTIIPGSGQPVSDQLALMTTDDHGNPLNPA